jgi:hypothetical protein
MVLAGIILLARGPSRLKADLQSLAEPQIARRLRIGLKLLLALAIVVAFGSLTRLPIYNLGPTKNLTLSPSELKIIEQLPADVEIEAFLSQLGEIRFGPLLALYERSPKITVKKSHGPGRAEQSGSGFQLALPDRAIIRAGPYIETVSPLSQLGLKAAFFRIVAPSRLVYNLIGDGQKSVQDQSSLGLSQWSSWLDRQKIFLRDHVWAPNSPLPQGGSALILAGPKVDLLDVKNTALLQYLAQGGRLLVMRDPLAKGLAAEAFEDLGLSLAEGLVVDPETAWAGTNDLFPVSHDFPAHPATLGLRQPVVWPMAGAILTAPGFNEKPKDPDNPLSSHTWAVAQSSPESFLETDLEQLAQRKPALNPETDLKGPLTLATATTLAQGGRLALVADSDLAANLFIANPGNLAFMDSLIHWLLGAEDDLAPRAESSFFYLTQTRARIMFWLPVVVWPILMTLLWALFYRRRRAA